MKTFRRLFALLFGGLVVLATVLVVKTIQYPVAPISNASDVAWQVDADSASLHLSQAIRIRTISTSDRNQRDLAQFEQFIAWLASTYPRVHASASRQIINGYSILFEWKGSNPALKPILLTGHYDVVPVEPGTESGWGNPPFSGTISDGLIWGRGALDDKGAIVAMLEAAEILLADGFVPERTIHFAFGHDEETGGTEGAGAIAAHVKASGVQYAWSLDEGSMVLEGILPGVKPRIASINVAEKGYMTVDLVANAPGGHSSLPPPDTAVATLAGAIDRLVKSPVPGGLTGVSGDFFDSVAGHMPFFQKLLFANQWLFAPVLERVLSGSAATNAMLRTTTAPTMLSGSVKENVLPAVAVGTVNFRLHPRDTVDGVARHISGAIDDKRIDIRVRPGAVPASTVSQSDGEGFEQIADAARSVFDNIIIVPGLTIAITDTRHWSTVSDNSYRFTPFVFGSDDIPRLHGRNERVSVANLVSGIQFYAELMHNSAGRP